MIDMAMHMMDIAQNSIRAEATKIDIGFEEQSSDATLLFYLSDNGSGMTKEMIEKLKNPFFTTRITRRVGLGIPFLKMTCEQTGGNMKINSQPGIGTSIEAVYKTDNPDCLPLGDIAGYLMLLIVGNPDIRINFSYKLDENRFHLDTEELRQNGITDFHNNEMASAIKEYINENLKDITSKRNKNSFLC